MAADYSILGFISQLLLSVIPSPEIWGILLVLVFAGYMAFRKFPMSASGHISMILVLSLAGTASTAGVVGGVFDLIKVVMIAVSGGVFFLGLWNFMGKR